jgi:P-type Cu+ transporter
MNSTTTSILAAGLLIAGAILLSGSPSTATIETNQTNSVTQVDGKQVIEITAKGGYTPGASLAKANVPTTLKIKTKGTFDCSAALKIPAIGYNKILQASAETLIEIPPQKPGAVVQGLCAMGMYNFQLSFN